MPRLRRSVLQAGPAAITLGLAGCFMVGGKNKEIRVRLQNGDSSTHELAVSIAFEGETLFERSATLDASESIDRSIENPDTSGSAHVEATLNDESPMTESVGIGSSTGIISIDVRITEDKGVWVVPTRE